MTFTLISVCFPLFGLQSSVLGAGGIMYINGKIVSGPLESFPEVLNPKNVMDLDKVSIMTILNKFMV